MRLHQFLQHVSETEASHGGDHHLAARVEYSLWTREPESAAAGIEVQGARLSEGLLNLSED